MSPLEPLAEQLAHLIEAADTPDRRALVEVLANRLYQLLAVPPLPPELQDYFGNPLSPGQPLADWCRARRNADDRGVSAFTPLLAAATLLDTLADSPSPLLVFDPAWFRVEVRGRLQVFLPQLALGMKAPGQACLSERQRRAYGSLVHPALLDSLDDIDPRSALLHSFTLFLVRILLGLGGSLDDRRDKPGGSLLDDLRRCRRRDRTLPPNLPELFAGLLERPAREPPEYSCRDLTALVLDHCRGNPFVCRPVLNRATAHELFAYSVFGLYKAEPANEDRVLCRHQGPVSFGLVADGVSTVDLGSGEMAAEEIVRLFHCRFRDRFDDLARTLAGRIEADPAYPWTTEAEGFLLDFFAQAHRQVVALTNQLWDPHSEVVPSAPLCSTLTAALVVFDQAVLGFVGDSPGLLFRRVSGRLSKLTSEDHAFMEEDYDPASNGPPYALTRVIGLCDFDAERRVFEPVERPVPLLRVQLQPGDLLLLASDGLLECIDEPTPAERFQRLEAALRGLHAADVPLKQLVQQLVRLGEDGLSDDNISVTALRIHGAAVLENPD